MLDGIEFLFVGAVVAHPNDFHHRAAASATMFGAGNQKLPSSLAFDPSNRDAFALGADHRNRVALLEFLSFSRLIEVLQVLRTFHAHMGIGGLIDAA